MQKNDWRALTESGGLCSATAVAVRWLTHEVQDRLREVPSVADARTAAELLRAAAWLLDQRADRDFAPLAAQLHEAFSE